MEMGICSAIGEEVDSPSEWIVKKDKIDLVHSQPYP